MLYGNYAADREPKVHLLQVTLTTVTRGRENTQVVFIGPYLSDVGAHMAAEYLAGSEQNRFRAQPPLSLTVVDEAAAEAHPTAARIPAHKLATYASTRVANHLHPMWLPPTLQN